MSTQRLASITLGLFLAGSMTLLAAPTKEEKEVEKYTKMLKNAKDAKDKVTALKELGRLGQIQVSLTKSVAPEIFKALDDKDSGVRAAAAHSIGKIDPEKKDEVVEKLIKMLKEEKVETVKTSVAEGLAAMGPDAKDALPALREAMTNAGKKGGREYQMAIQSISGKKK
jgi:HEAT repeat protein